MKGNTAILGNPRWKLMFMPWLTLNESKPDPLHGARRAMALWISVVSLRNDHPSRNKLDLGLTSFSYDPDAGLHFPILNSHSS